MTNVKAWAERNQAGLYVNHGGGRAPPLLHASFIPRIPRPRPNCVRGIKAGRRYLRTSNNTNLAPRISLRHE